MSPFFFTSNTSQHCTPVVIFLQGKANRLPVYPRLHNLHKELSEASNLIIYLVSHEWEEWVRNDIASPALGDKMLFRHGDREVPCRVVKVAICPSSCNTSYLSILPNICICRLRKAKTTQTFPNTSIIRSLYCTPSGGHPAKLTLSRAKKCKFATAHATTSDSVVANFLGVGLFG